MYLCIRPYSSFFSLKDKILFLLTDLVERDIYLYRFGFLGTERHRIRGIQETKTKRREQEREKEEEEGVGKILRSI